jgi:hypothetical protein
LPGKFRIEVDVRNRIHGPVFGYRGSFDAEWPAIGPEEVPAGVKPRREEPRE